MFSLGWKKIKRGIVPTLCCPRALPEARMCSKSLTECKKMEDSCSISYRIPEKLEIHFPSTSDLTCWIKEPLSTKVPFPVPLIPTVRGLFAG